MDPYLGVGIKHRKRASLMTAAIHVRIAQEQLTGDLIVIDAAAFKQLATDTGTPFHVSEMRSVEYSSLVRSSPTDSVESSTISKTARTRLTHQKPRHSWRNIMDP